ncbi:MAG: hypothetical protein ABI130_11375 [Leifsonia sp.]
MDESAGVQTPFITPLRLLIGSLLAGMGLVFLGFFLGLDSASAAEPAPLPDPAAHSLLGSAGSLLSGVGGAVSSTVNTAAADISKPLAAALPTPAQQAVSTVTAPVAAVVHEVAASPPVARAVTPVVTAVDGALTSIPLTHDLIGNTPLGAVLAPVSGTIDQTIGAIAGVGTGVLGPAPGHVGPGQPPIASPSPGSPEIDPVPTLGSSSVSAGSTIVGCPVPDAVHRMSVVVDVTAPGMTLAFGPTRATVPTPGAPPLRGNDPLGQPTTTSNGASASSTGWVNRGASMTENVATPYAALGENTSAADDRLPASPVADHDTSPD